MYQTNLYDMPLPTEEWVSKLNETCEHQKLPIRQGPAFRLLPRFDRVTVVDISYPIQFNMRRFYFWSEGFLKPLWACNKLFPAYVDLY